jgi:uncharacterized protein (TIGR02271 family)
MPLAEEEAHIEKRSVAAGKVRVQTIVDVIEDVACATLEQEAVEVTRVPVGATVEALPQIRTEGDVTIIPVLEEVLFVEKRLVLVEEIHIRRRTKTETVEVPVSLRKQRAVLENVPPEPDNSVRKDV